jgi:tetratricopeptide (TPR) repeat protein
LKVRVGLAGALLAFMFSAPSRADDSVRSEDTGSDQTPTVSESGSSPYENALRLARMLHADSVVAELLSGRAQDAALSSADLTTIVASLEAIGDPERAAALLEYREPLFPSETFAGAPLARLEARRGDPAREARAWQEFIRRAGPLAEIGHGLAYARALSALGRNPEALRAARDFIPRAKPTDHDFWRDLSILAWDLSDDDTALIALRALSSQGALDGSASKRLMTLEAERGNSEAAARIGVSDYVKERDPESLLFAANLEAERGQWRAVSNTLALAPEGALSENFEYWILSAEAHEQLGEERLALIAYQRAHTLNPASADAKEALLWEAVAHAGDGKLRALLADFGSKVDPSLWDVYAVALHRLGDTRRALRYFVRELRQSSVEQPLLELEFADALSEVGRPALARRVREKALAALKPVEGALLDKLVRHQRLTASEAETLRADIESRVGQGGTPQSDRSLARYLAARAGSLDSRMLPEVATNTGEVDSESGLPLLTDDESRVSTLRAELDRNQGDEPEAELRGELDELSVRHAALLGAGARYMYLNGLRLRQVEVGQEHDLWGLRLLAGAQGLTLQADRNVLASRAVYDELGVDFTLRAVGKQSETEVRLGVVAQSEGTLPRLGFGHQRTVFGGQLDLTFDAQTSVPIEDSPLLRLAAVRHTALGTGHLEYRSIYLDLEAEGSVDQTRHAEHLADQLSTTEELGVRLLRERPEWQLGVQATQVARSNVTTIPARIRPLLLPGAEFDAFLPSGYESIIATTRLTRGKLSERSRVEPGSESRWECELGLGWVLPKNESTSIVRCSADVRVLRAGWLSAGARYETGFAGIANWKLFALNLSYTHML